ncbi:DUF4190 domain-containing protein [Streptomyces sp. G44]|uniref:DUF4190 domain-containing protein n=1 Tax=Streptomyces sp. G44 TaxID=2807632 RepID=UPI001961C8AB|nr:DUF4190 domain-containing protein [Streptomyces sp. G44]MBM7171260.1 DUF4190 domain-containing protein [Streptomyces sp. G44]
MTAIPPRPEDDAAPAGATAPGERDPWAPPPEDAVPPPPPAARVPAAGAPFAAPGEPVPPPPLSPEGPGQVPYGYEGPAGYGAHGGYPGHAGHAHAPGQYGYPGYPGYAGQGVPGMPGYGWPAMPMAPANGMGVTGLVLGIIAAAVFCLWPLAIVLGILAVIFGAVGRGKARRGEATNGGQALAGIICGVVGIVLGVALLVVTVVTADDETDTRSLEPPARATATATAPD